MNPGPERNATVSDSLALSTPYVTPRQTKEDKHRAEVLARGNDLVDCPQCQAPDAEREPPVLSIRAGYQALQTTTRCLTCGPVITREEPVPMPAPEPAYDPYYVEVKWKGEPCECGCGEPTPVGKRFAGQPCALKLARAKRYGHPWPPKSSPPPAEEQAPTQPDPPSSGEGNASTPPPSTEFAPAGLTRTPPEEGTPPPIAAPLEKVKLCDCGCGRPCLGVRRWATNECRTPFQQAKDYLLRLTEEQRQTFFECVTAEAQLRALVKRCQNLGLVVS